MTRVLMFGWEFPPYKSGGLGTACYQLTKGLAKQGANVTFVMPIAPENAKADFVNLLGASAVAKNVRIKKVPSTLVAYTNSATYEENHHYNIMGSKASTVYGKTLFEEVKRYAALAKHIAKRERHDVIHAHDWMTYEAAINAKKTSKKPLIVHLHATEFDRTGGNPDPRVSHTEWKGLNAADKIITNSNYCKQTIVKHYNIDPDKIHVVHWGIEEEDIPRYNTKKTHNTVLFLGRVTLQKGPDYFIETAHNVLKHEPDTHFVMAGTGDMLPRIINRAAELGISNKISFTGALKGDDVNKAYQAADLFVMPSVSEPFGLVALESIKNGTPVLISKQSGVSEVIHHALKADFWDINDMTNKIVSALRYPVLPKQLKEENAKEIKQFNLDKPAQAIKRIYDETTQNIKRPKIKVTSKKRGNT